MRIDSNKLNEYLKKITLGKCPLCDYEQWEVSDYVLGLNEYPEEPKDVLKCAPLITLTCERCGYVRFINVLNAKLTTVEELENSQKLINDEANDGQRKQI